MDFDQELASVAEEYRNEGYQVTLRPQGSNLPVFAAGHMVELLASRGSEHVLVQVKQSSEELRNDRTATYLADQVEKHPGWRLDLVVLNRQVAADAVSDDAAEPPLGEIEQNLSHAEQMSRAGELPLSCVVSWAALEAAMRHAARATGIAVKSAAPSFLLRALYAEGLLPRSDFDHLNEAIKVRNAVVHGLRLPAIDPGLPPYVATIARKLLAENGQKPAA
jgi:hypothetical protein